MRTVTKEQLTEITERMRNAHKAGFEDELAGNPEMEFASIHEKEAYNMGRIRAAAFLQAERDRIG